MKRGYLGLEVLALLLKLRGKEVVILSDSVVNLLKKHSVIHLATSLSSRGKGQVRGVWQVQYDRGVFLVMLLLVFLQRSNEMNVH